ncbi:hypothetical protein [Klebsiella pneumoniae]|nr:hypothetical protein [Klebsiella pneumoniae]
MKILSTVKYKVALASTALLFLQVLLRLKALQVVLIMQVRQWMLC